MRARGEVGGRERVAERIGGRGQHQGAQWRAAGAEHGERRRASEARHAAAVDRTASPLTSARPPNGGKPSACRLVSSRVRRIAGIGPPAVDDDLVVGQPGLDEDAPRPGARPDQPRCPHEQPSACSAAR